VTMQGVVLTSRPRDCHGETDRQCNSSFKVPHMGFKSCQVKVNGRCGAQKQALAAGSRS
jgi:hypothetical protein